MFSFSGYYYYITLGLQAICVIHCLRKGTNTTWIWAIIFLPVLGSLAYMFIEMFSGRGFDMQQLQSGVGNVFNPGGNIKNLETQLRFSDTFNNKVALADAYLAAQQTDKAIALYEDSLQGAFTENEYVQAQLIIAYNLTGRYSDILPIAKKIYHLPQFIRSRVHILYAMALEKTGNSALAETEFKTMKVRYAYFEARYQYGLFLIRAGRNTEAKTIFTEMADEYGYLTSREKRANRKWARAAKDQLKKINTL